MDGFIIIFRTLACAKRSTKNFEYKTFLLIQGVKMSGLFKEEYEVIIEKNVIIKMRDGIKLATDVYRPAVKGKPIEDRFPTLLVRTPYNKNRNVADAIWFCKRGYTVCIQDLRGVFKSEGSFVKYEFSDIDGYDTIEWIAKQDWSTGKVGTFGGSFLAHIQVSAATTNPPHLSAMVITQGGYANGYLTSIRHGGAMEMTSICWLLVRALNSKEAAANPVLKAALESIELDGYLDPKGGQLKEGVTPFSLIPNYEKVFFDSLTHSEYDEYWKKPWHSAELYYDQFSDVPILIEGGWYDHYTQNTSELYIGLSKRKKGPIKLIFGPWAHGGQSLTYAGEVDFGPTASLDVNIAPSYNHLRLGWFDRFLKGKENGAENDPSVRLFVMGGGNGQKKCQVMQHDGRWRIEKDWPLPGTKYTEYYFHKNNALSPESPKGKKSNVSYTFDPRDPVPTIGGNRHTHFMLGGENRVKYEGAFDQIERPGYFACKPPYLPLAFRNDVLVFKTPPLKNAIEVTGPIKVRLWASSSAVDTDFTAKLIDWHPPNPDYPMGFAMNLTDGIIRTRYRNSWEKQELMEPGKIYSFDITLYPTSNLFTKDHRIRVDISSSNWPRFDINPNTGDPLGKSRRFIIAHNTIYHDTKHPSHIVLPIITSRAS